VSPRLKGDGEDGESQVIPRHFFWLFDSLAIALAYLAAHALLPWVRLSLRATGLDTTPWIRALSPPRDWGYVSSLRDYAWVLVITVLVVIVLLDLAGVHRSLLAQSRTRLVLSTVGAPLLGLAVVNLLFFALAAQRGSRLLIFAFTAISGCILLTYRALLRRQLSRRRAAGAYAQNVLVVGGTEATVRLAERLGRKPLSERYRVFGCLRPASEPANESAAGVPVLGVVADLPQLLISRPIEEVIALAPVNGGEWIKDVVRACDDFGVALHIVPEAFLPLATDRLRPSRTLDLVAVPTLDLLPPHHDSEALFAKRLIDIVVSATLLFLLAPLFVIVAALIKLLNPRLTIFYPWRVVGRFGREFTGYKFTTMVADADHQKASLMDRNEMTGPVFKIRDDPRVTPLGRWLRKYSINELPQLWSVLKGDMSLVGPRPAGRHELDRYDLWHKRKLSVIPGITCLWQVRGRNAISDFDDWVRMDLEYIDHWSLWLDFKILVWTAKAVVAGTGS
jgi:exopolysaccharide biosynthesis polyprenyl glycosylphosphotransferase